MSKADAAATDKPKVRFWNHVAITAAFYLPAYVAASLVVGGGWRFSCAFALMFFAGFLRGDCNG